MIIYQTTLHQGLSVYPKTLGPFETIRIPAGPTDVSRRVQLGLAELNSVTGSRRLHLEIGATWEMIPVWSLKMGGLYHVVSPKFAV